jgi:hypothetical protein
VTITLPGPAAPAPPRLRPVLYEPLPGQGPARAAPAEPPRREPPATVPREIVEAHRAASHILRRALEVLDGRRPPAQLAPYFAPRPLRYWRAAAAQHAPRSRTRHGRLRICLPRTGVAEIATTCHVDGAIRALAARFEHTDGRWRCTVVRLI